jgi:hypothetical protein
MAQQQRILERVQFEVAVGDTPVAKSLESVRFNSATFHVRGIFQMGDSTD